jgi:hypothetical protein
MNLVVSQFPYCPKTNGLGRKMIAVIPTKTYWTFVLFAFGGFRKSTNELNSGLPPRQSGFLEEKSQDQRHDDSLAVK